MANKERLAVDDNDWHELERIEKELRDLEEDGGDLAVTRYRATLMLRCIQLATAVRAMLPREL